VGGNNTDFFSGSFLLALCCGEFVNSSRRETEGAEAAEEDVVGLHLTAVHPCGFRLIRDIRVEVVQPGLQFSARSAVLLPFSA